jgi:hypothetical protein
LSGDTHRTTALPRCVVNGVALENAVEVGMHRTLAAHLEDGPGWAVLVCNQRGYPPSPHRPGVTWGHGAERAASM